MLFRSNRGGVPVLQLGHGEEAVGDVAGVRLGDLAGPVFLLLLGGGLLLGDVVTVRQGERGPRGVQGGSLRERVDGLGRAGSSDERRAEREPARAVVRLGGRDLLAEPDRLVELATRLEPVRERSGGGRPGAGLLLGGRRGLPFGGSRLQRLAQTGLIVGGPVAPLDGGGGRDGDRVADRIGGDVRATLFFVVAAGTRRTRAVNELHKRHR